MEKMLLSLKSIYKLLMNNDFPIYSESVIPEKNRKGQTLLRFWNSILAEEFRSLPCGKTIWRNDGKRNRYLSNLCNRSTELKLYREYAKEIATQVSETTLLNQISRFEKFLSAREYRHDILMRRIWEMTRLCKSEDARVTSAIVQHISENASVSDSLEHIDAHGNLFQAGYLLSILTLYAAAGEAMDLSSMTVLLDERYSIHALWETRQRLAREHHSQVSFLTVHSGMIQDNPLPQHRFFGREEELYDLQEIASARRKCLVSGIGGIGKTELIRQLLRLCAEENTVNKIAVIPYETGLAESFSRAFPGSHLPKPEDNLRHILSSLEQEAENGQHILLIVDDLDKGLEEDPWLTKLLDLPCGVLITTRRNQLSGFEVYRLESPSVTTGTLIFRDNYGLPLSRDDRDLLREMLQEESLCHPLTLYLMARAARCRNWSVGQLKGHLQEEGVALTWVEAERTIRISQMYNQLYSFQQIPEDHRQIVQLFTLMPSGSYSEEFLHSVFPEIMGEDFSDRLLQLVNGGWLDFGTSGYFMHPLIAECLRRKVITEERILTVLSCLHRKLPQLQLLENSMVHYDDEGQQVAQILLYISRYLTGNVSRTLMADILNAANTRNLTQTVKEKLNKDLRVLLNHCQEMDDVTELIYCAILGNWGFADFDRCKTIFSHQKASLSVPKSLFLDFCLCVGSDMSGRANPEAIDLLMEAQTEDASPFQRATAYFHISGCYQVTGKAELALQWSEQGVRYVTAHPECGTLATFNNLFSLCNQALMFRMQDRAKELLEQLEKMLDGISDPDLNAQIFSLYGLYEMVYGDQEMALEYIQKQLAINLEYYGKDRNHYSLLGSIGDLLGKLERYDEAVANYEECLAYAHRCNDHKMLQMKCNNASVLYLRMKQPLKALVLLETAIAEGRVTGGLMLGESLRNAAQAYGQLEDFQNEYHYYKEAMPLLLEAYGPDHPRATTVAQRLKELEPAFA